MAFGIDRPAPRPASASAPVAKPTRNPKAKLARLALAFALAGSLYPASLGAAASAPAYAADGVSTAASSQTAYGKSAAEQRTATCLADGQEASPCRPSAQQLAAWEADGTLEERQAYAAAFEHSQPDPALVAQAAARESAASADNSEGSRSADLLATLPVSWQSGMASVGEARILALRVSFPAGDGEPAMTFPEDDSLEALQNLIDGDGGAYPYESLSAYYERASYGKLSISGKAYDYQAKHPRSYYETDVSELFYEALDALDDRLDYADFDGNGDGIIDGVYIHQAGGTDGWGTPWWSYTRTDTSGITFDGLEICRLVTLADSSGSERASRTLIHETGHVLGLPDYYSYRAMEGSLSGRTGILTFDMMMDNIGDHNGFSKWLLGWLEDSDITRVVAASSGITALRDGNVVAAASADQVATGIELTLDAFTSNDSEETGGIIVLSNADEGIFSSYYVLQYDRFAGNQSVYYQSANESEPLPSGWRMYRVQAGLTEGSFDFARTNTYGVPTDQLIELVDPDGDAQHLSIDGFAPCASSGDFACMLFDGDEVTPDSYPSTNFYESKGLGYTGISVKAGDCSEEAGSITVSHSGKDAPDLPEFELTLREGYYAYNAGTLVFDATTAPRTDAQAVLGADTRLVVDGVAHPTALEVDGTTITVSCYFDADEISPDSSCEIIFPAKQFIVSETAEGTVYSPEIRIPLDTGDVARIARTGSYGADTMSDLCKQTSNTITLGDGTLAFFQATGSDLTLNRVTADGSSLARLAVSDVDSAIAAQSALSATDLSDGHLLLAISNPDGASMEMHVIDIETGAVAASGRIESVSSPSIAAIGDGSFAVLSPLPGSSRFYATLMAPRPDGTLSMRYVSFDSDGAFAAGNGFVALAEASYNASDPKTTVSLVRTEDLASLASTHGSNDFDDTYSGEGSLSNAGYAPSVPCVVELPCDGYLSIADVAASEAGFAVLSNAKADGAMADGSLNIVAASTALSFSSEGDLRFARSIDSSQTDSHWILPFSEISLNDKGGIAVTRRSERFPSLFVGNETLLIGANGTASNAANTDASTAAGTSRLITFSTGEGTWLADGSWIAIGWHMDAYPSIAGSPNASGDALESGESAAAIVNLNDLIYHITDPIAASSEPDEPSRPDDPAEPTDPNAPSEEEASDKPSTGKPGTALAATGDEARQILAAAIAVAAFAGTIAIAMRRAR